MRRRELLEQCAAAGVLLGVADFGKLTRAWAAASAKKPTAQCELGPFYKRGVAGSAKLRTRSSSGMPLDLAGTIYNTRGELVRDAKLELWHADAAGIYSTDLDLFRATLLPTDGTYRVESVMPGHYPGRAAQHVHMLVRAPGHRPLVTQLYFATDPIFDGDPAKNYRREPLAPTADLIRPVTISGETTTPVANVTFDLVLERS